MRRIRSNILNNEARVDLTPMLDVVFILLIFFIVTSTFIQEDAIGLEPPPPPSPSNSEQKFPAIMATIDASDNIRMNGVFTDIASVRSTVERLKAEDPNRSLIIQAHPEAQSGTVIQLRDQAYLANLQRVNILRTEDAK